MARTIRILVFSAFLLIIPTRTTPPALYPSAGLLSCRTIRGKVVLIRKYLLLQRFSSGDENKALVKICDITVAVELDRVALVHAPPLMDSSNQLAVDVQKESQLKVQEVVYGTANNRPLPPML